MKMEVVLSSPGRYEDDGTPFKNEEIREWSGVDQITGMLERARIETGRWRAFNNGSAHSYGKVIDSRQRNSLDGTVIQKARRQVEVFQSQEPGRSVQVVRASQWSSSRVTDNLDAPHSLRSSQKFPFLKRSTSDEDLSLFPLANPPKSPTSTFARASKLRRSLQIPSHTSKISLPAPNSQKYPTDPEKFLDNHLIPEKSSPNSENSTPKTSPKSSENHYSLENPQKSSDNSYIPGNPVENHYIPLSSAITLRDPKKSEIAIKNPSPKSPRSRISSPKPQRSQVTVVNLINSPKTSIVTLGPSESLKIPSIPQNLSKKKVGFCKTEIHFAADSGKVNIVETDGKPPPTNKFRRRKRNQILSPNLLRNKDEDLGIVGDLEKRVWINPEANPKIHTTKICLGNSVVGGGDKIEFKTRGDLESPKAVSEIISRGNLGIIVSRDSDHNKVLSTVVKTHESTIARVEDNVSNVKNNITSLKKSLDGDKTNEIEKKIENEDGEGGEDKKMRSPDFEAAGPVYVNVFRGDGDGDKFPVYENYRATNDKKEKTGIKVVKEEKAREEKVLKGSKGKIPNKGIKTSSVKRRESQSSASTSGRSQKEVGKVKSVKRPISGDETRTKKQPMEVVYRTAVYNMKNEKLAKPSPSKQSKSGPRLINDLICGAKPKKPTNSSKRKSSTSSQGAKSFSQAPRHWK